MAWTQSDVDVLDEKIREAIVSGVWLVQTIQFSDQATTLRSLKDAFALRATMQGLANAAAGVSTTRYGATSKGV